ncbi:MAG: NTP transferase domain-containing protein [Faecousia sp.]|nr:nucleotidyltransferase family protein [Bacillota bacterium]
MQTLKIGCVVMAAGNAARFGKNKLAAEVNGKSLIRHALEAVPKEPFSRVAVVTQYPEIAEMAREFGFEPIENKHPDYGISHTIALGTQALSECDAILYLVSDQPLLDSASVARVVSCWREHPQYIVGAAHNGKRGNPCIFPREFYGELLALTEDHGGNSVIRCHPDRLLTVEVAQEELTDVDTPKALKDLQTQLGKQAP